MEQDEIRKRETMIAISDAADALGLPCKNGVVYVFLGQDGYPSGEVDEYEIDCTAADPKRLLDHITATLFREAYCKGERDAFSMLRSVIGAAAA